MSQLDWRRRLQRYELADLSLAIILRHNVSCIAGCVLRSTLSAPVAAHMQPVAAGPGAARYKRGNAARQHSWSASRGQLLDVLSRDVDLCGRYGVEAVAYSYAVCMCIHAQVLRMHGRHSCIHACMLLPDPAPHRM